MISSALLDTGSVIVGFVVLVDCVVYTASTVTVVSLVFWPQGSVSDRTHRQVNRRQIGLLGSSFVSWASTDFFSESQNEGLKFTVPLSREIVSLFMTSDL